MSKDPYLVDDSGVPAALDQVRDVMNRSAWDRGDWLELTWGDPFQALASHRFGDGFHIHTLPSGAQVSRHPGGTIGGIRCPDSLIQRSLGGLSLTRPHN